MKNAHKIKIPNTLDSNKRKGIYNFHLAHFNKDLSNKKLIIMIQQAEE